MDEAFVSRGGQKLAHALRDFHLDVAGLTCADMGCSTGGFTHCLLARGAAKIYAIDTAYGELAWTLRNDPRVVVMERTNALRAVLPEPVDLVVVDLGWTTQRRLLPAARALLRPSSRGIVTLVKPHYECKDLGVALPRGGVLGEAMGEEVSRRVLDELVREHGAVVRGVCASPILGGKQERTGNREWLAWIDGS